MTFVTSFALAIALFVVVPYWAHRLRRQRADEHLFAAVRLVPPTMPQARRRARLEDRALFATRALAVCGLALLGAAPFVRCSRLSLHRTGGASVALAIVLDDSMSMRADVRGTSRFERAREGARQLLASAREGDAVAIVLAGAPARVALAATTDLGAARAVIDQVSESDRGTDLDSARTMAHALIAQLPQVDRRIVVLSDLADGRPDTPFPDAEDKIPVSTPLPELRGQASDCGILAADRIGKQVRVHVACGSASPNPGREVVVRARSKSGPPLAKAALPTGDGDVELVLPDEEAIELVASLTGQDAIASDDEAQVVTENGPRALAVVAESTDLGAATGGAPLVEQALAALRLEVPVRPIPLLPDRIEDIAEFAGIMLDDPAGFTPEQRRALAVFLERGGLVLVAAGPRASAAPLGASFEPILESAPRWKPSPAKGVDTERLSLLGESLASLAELSPRGRTELTAEDTRVLEPLLAWKDGALFLGKRSIGRGEAWLVTLPFGTDASELPFRPGFLALLDAWTTEARQRASPRRTPAGAPWRFLGAKEVVASGPHGPVPIQRESGAEAVVRVEPPEIGVYRLKVDGREELRVAAPVQQELDLRPRPPSSPLAGGPLGEQASPVDVSWVVALVLLGLMVLEMALRFWSRRSEEEGTTGTLPGSRAIG